MNVLFICRANAGRSQVAEAFYNDITGTNDAISAGVDLKNSTKGDDPSIPDLVIEVMEEAGLDISEKLRKNVTPEMVESAEMVVLITDYPMPDYVLRHKNIIDWSDIPDAVRTPIESQRVMRDTVMGRVKELVRKEVTV